MKLSSLSLAFPAYNEEANVGRAIETALKVGEQVADDVEVIVVNDGSRDRTKEIIEQYAAVDPRVRLIDHPVNKGYGQTVWDGLKAARKDWIFFTDADLQFDLKEITRLIEFTPDFQIILGIRSPRRDPLIRLANAKMWNLFVRLLFGVKVSDIDCAFKLFARDTLTDLEIKTGGATFSTELMLRLQKKGHLFKEVPVTHLPRTAGKQTGANAKVIARAFKEVFLLYRTTDLGVPLYRDLLKFGVVGLISTVLDLAALNLFFVGLNTNIYWATFAGFVVGSLNGYFLNNAWTYKRLGKEAKASGLIKYTLISAVGLALTEGIMHFFSVEAGVNYNISKLIAVGVVFFWNFFGNRFWTFRNS